MKSKMIFLGILLTSLLVLGSILNKTRILEQEESLENVELAIYLEEEKTNTIPSKNSGYYIDFEKTSCTNGAYINWDNNTWSPVIHNAKNYPVHCEIYFSKKYYEGMLNGTDPVLKDELIPVNIDEKGIVKRASLADEG